MLLIVDAAPPSGSLSGPNTIDHSFLEELVRRHDNSLSEVLECMLRLLLIAEKKLWNAGD